MRLTAKIECMRKNLFSKYIPSPKTLKNHSALKPIRHLLSNKHLFHINRRSVAGAVFIGLFCSFIPLPSQMLIAAIFCLWFRCNVPIGVSLVWISNPVTMGPIFYFAYKLGSWVLGVQIDTGESEFSFKWLWDNLLNIGYPLIIGSLICAWITATIGFFSVHLSWRVYVARTWNRRKGNQ